MSSLSTRVRRHIANGSRKITIANTKLLKSDTELGQQPVLIAWETQ